MQFLVSSSSVQPEPADLFIILRTKSSDCFFRFLSLDRASENFKSETTSCLLIGSQQN